MLSIMENTVNIDTIESHLAGMFRDRQYTKDDRSITFTVPSHFVTNPIKDELVRRTQKAGLAVEFLNMGTMEHIIVVNVK